jgi:crotonobetaine/carnitine-CoA ligase
LEDRGLDEKQTWSRQLERHARERPNNAAWVCGHERLTYESLQASVLAFSSGFSALGVHPGERVALMAPTCTEMVVALLAAARSGAAAVPLSIYLKGASLAHQLRNSAAAVVVADGDGMRLLAAVAEDLPDLRVAVLIGERPSDVPSLAGVRELSYDEVAQLGDPVFAEPHPAAEDLFGILYTSGTTGLPKGCMVSHGYSAWWGEHFRDFTAATSDDVLFTAAPLYHIGSLVPLAGALHLGATIVAEPSFSASRYLARAAQTGATLAIGVGWIAQAILSRAPEEADRAHRLRAMSTVGLSTDERQQFRDRFGVPALTQQYGQTECWPVAYTSFARNEFTDDCGEVTADLHVELHDDLGDPVPDGAVGEIVLRPRCRFRMFDGYWQDSRRTADAFKGLWFHTGDMGRLQDGRLRYVDRKKDSMRRRGENISAYELEQIALRHPEIAEVAVFGVQTHDDPEQSVFAAVVPATESLGAAEVHAYFQAELPYYAVPRFVALGSSLPRNASGRVMKDELRGTFAELEAVDFQGDHRIVDKALRRRI